MVDNKDIYAAIYRIYWSPFSFTIGVDQTSFPKFVNLRVTGQLANILNGIKEIEKKSIKIQCVRRNDVILDLNPALNPITEGEDNCVKLDVHATECIINSQGIEIIGSMSQFVFTKKTMKWAEAIKTYVDGGTKSNLNTFLYRHQNKFNFSSREVELPEEFLFTNRNFSKYKPLINESVEDLSKIYIS